jgi:hypothetical protein
MCLSFLHVTLLCVIVCGDRRGPTHECVDNVHFRGGSPHFHKTTLKEGKRLFGSKVGPTLSHV